VEEVVDIVICLVEMVAQVLDQEMQFRLVLVIHLQLHLLKVIMEEQVEQVLETTEEAVVEEQEE
tara:strand:- start:339 stop:530 length:192 start_codon:yes stop_codon:yes gene_type:complete